MTHEVSPPPDPFRFSAEGLDERISQDHFMALLTDAHTVVHHIEVATNHHGEFLLVTLSQPVGAERHFLTFWGLGFHRTQKRWLTDEWYYAPTRQILHQLPQQIAPADAQAWIAERRAALVPATFL